eukprot:CAMPEP_0119052278 /NCGR_PEP_ID=MMETSP1177-20130426/73628_1 /TAXON_ID=2985 /ORGANISM="Ochromonas sp, Strain CCMP1899" /LENGTH=899 /DNA_ID=CAMNT_0007031793 /DNA_START=58 /DNA_END=2754 /DNA_ORIENTATION=-
MVNINCPICDRSLNVAGLAKHINNVHGHCKTNGSPRTFEEGYRTLIELRATNNQMTEWEECNRCGLYCKNAQGLARHQGENRCLNVRGFVEALPLEAPPAAPLMGLQIMNDALHADNDNAPNNEGLNALLEAANMDNIDEDNAADRDNIDENNANENELNMPAPEALLADIGIDEENFRALAVSFNLPLYYVHYTWTKLLRDIMTKLLHGMVHRNLKFAARNILAFHLLPGMVELMRRVRNFMKPIDFMRGIDGAHDPAVSIIRIAVSWKQKLGDREIRYKEQTIPFLMAKIERCISVGLISKANRILAQVENLTKGIANPPMISDAVFRQKVIDLHPPTNQFDILPPIDEDPPESEALQVTSYNVRDTMRKLPRNSSNGTTGSTYTLLSKVTDDRNEDDTVPHEMYVAIANFFNKILIGGFIGSGICAMLLFRKKLVLTPKDDGGLRPIAVIDTLGRILSICANKEGTKYMGNILGDHQLGLGMPSGCQMSHMHTQLAFSKGDTVLSIDQSNAFNSLRNSKVYAGLKKYCPGLIKFFRTQIDVPQIIENHVGEIMGLSYMGPTQGDACGSLFYCVGTQDVNIEINHEVKLVEEAFRLLNPDLVVSQSRVKAIIDDVTLSGHPEVIAIISSSLQGIYDKHQMHMNPSKSVITGLNMDTTTEPIPEGLRVSYNGLKCLGGWAGTATAKDDYYEKKLLEWAPPLKAYKLLSPAAILQILQKSHNNKPNYLFSLALNMESVLPYAEKYDNYTEEIMTQTFTLPTLQVQLRLDINDGNGFFNDTTTMKSLMFLPSKCGGVGMTRHGGMTTEIALMKNWLKFKDFIQTFSANDLHHTYSPTYGEVVPGTTEGLENYTGLTQEDLGTLTAANATNILKSAKNQAYSNLAKNIAAQNAAIPGRKAW